MYQIQKIGSDVIFFSYFFHTGSLHNSCSRSAYAENSHIVCVCIYIYIGHGLILAGIALYILSSKPFFEI
jgi:hypothetical protein